MSAFWVTILSLWQTAHPTGYTGVYTWGQPTEWACAVELYQPLAQPGHSHSVWNEAYKADRFDENEPLWPACDAAAEAAFTDWCGAFESQVSPPDYCLF